MKVICTRTIPKLCKKGETGEIKSVERTRIKTGRTSFYCNDPWYRVERLANGIEFNFKKPFDNEDVKRIFGKEIELKDFFKKVD